MPTDHRERLARIRSFTQLIVYLRIELGWPIVSDDFEELTFEYTAEELGIDAKNAAKIQEIKRLRPLVPGQPWGIFFVKFEPKRLPVVALRRILGQVALKKRASANKSERQAWAADDLLFVSNYGEGEERRIVLAHFSKPRDGHDLPTLKVLGWDNLDTPLHLDAVARELTNNLTWPDDDGDTAAWRKRWRAAFTLRHGEVITTSKQLSGRLADLACAIRDRTKTALAIETESGPLTKLMNAFQTALVHDLDETGFADMYAQTIAYGLLSARITDPERRTADDFAAHMRTNPFLKELMETFLHVGGRRGKAGGPGIDFDELGVSEVVELLDQANMDAVVRDFGDRNPQEDPVIHFYEHFLAAYDKNQKVSRGVFYTPRPVVSYIVRSVDEILRSEFGLTDGLADTITWGEMAKRHDDLKIPAGTPPAHAFVQILDPATGTGTFLVEVIGLIYNTMAAKWQSQGQGKTKIQALWNDYVSKHLLPRLHGYELLMAPYAIAHLKIGLKLYETGYRFGSDERARVYLTNALEPAGGKQLTLDFLPALAHEHAAVNEIKQTQQFTVVIGNPPYASISSNMQPVVRKIIDPYRYVDGVPIKEKGALQFEKNLNEDYVKFFRFAESMIEQSVGVAGLITSNSYIESATLRGLRSHLLNTFSSLRFLDLHGDVDKREKTADGRPDKNVFEIKHGVAISLMCRSPSMMRSGEKGHAHLLDLKGQRDEKSQWLSRESVRSVQWIRLRPRHDRYNFSEEDSVRAAEYDSYISVADLFDVNSTGFESGRDEVLTAFTRKELATKLRAFCEGPASVVRKQFSVEKGWGAVLFGARSDILDDPDFEARLREFLFGPFDIRWCFYRKDLLKTNSFSAGKHLCYGPNRALVVMRQVSIDAPFTHAGVSKYIVNNRCFYSTKGKASYFPQYLYSGESDLVRRGGEFIGTNLRRDEVGRFANALGLEWAEEDEGDVRGRLSSIDLFNFVYSILHSKKYRERYGKSLRTDFPRLPLTTNVDLFRALTSLGGELMGLHVMGSPKLRNFVTTYTGPKNPEVDRVGWSDGTVWLDAGKTIAQESHRATEPGTIGFSGVPEEIWDFQIGGYQVCHKWLKDRKGRTLSDEDIAHYQKIVVALNETIRIMAAIDEVIESYGGWPDAFQTGSGADAASRGAG